MRIYHKYFLFILPVLSILTACSGSTTDGLLPSATNSPTNLVNTRTTDTVANKSFPASNYIYPDANATDIPDTVSSVSIGFTDQVTQEMVNSYQFNLVRQDQAGEINLTPVLTSPVLLHLDLQQSLQANAVYKLKVQDITDSSVFAEWSFSTAQPAFVDTQAPTTPQNLKTSASPTYQLVSLSWTASLDNVAVTGYRIFRNSQLLSTVGTASFSDTTVQGGQTYSYSVSAFDAANNQSTSTTLVVNTPSAPDTTAPTVPGNLHTTSTPKSSNVSLAWNASIDNVSVTGYRVYRDSQLLSTVTTTSFSDTTVQDGQNYTYAVRAIDAANNQSNSATLVVATPSAADTTAPSAPANLIATSAPTSSTVSIAWDASTDNIGVTGYKVYRDNSLVTTTTGLSYTNIGLSPNTTYVYLVTAFDAAGNVANSSQLSVTTATTTVSAGSPRILYTDALSGPISGGENNKGAYLSLYGTNFGQASDLGTLTKVYIGGQEVDNYLGLEPSVVFDKFGIQKLTVQVGTIGNPTLGVALPVKICINVSTDCSNEDNTFTPNNGRILFVALNGDDATAEYGNINKPWRHLQTATNGGNTRGGAYADLRAGDHVVIRGGNWSDVAFEGAWLRFRDPHAMGSADNWIHFTAYPGETVTYTTPAGAKGGFQGPGSAYAGTTGEYISMSNLHMIIDPSATTDAAPFNQQYGEGAWRVVNNEIGPWLSVEDARAGGYSGGGQGTKILGNYMHDIRRVCDATNSGTNEFNANCPNGSVGGGERLLNHGIYIDGGANNTEIAYNYIDNILEGNLIQTYASNGVDIWNIRIHHNWMQNSGKFGLNISSHSYSGAIYDNVIIGAYHSGITINVAFDQAMDWVIAHNTFINNDRASGGYGQISNQWGNYNLHGTVLVTDNIFYSNLNNGTKFYVNMGDSDSYMSFGKNLYYAGSSTASSPGTVMNVNPQFNNVSLNDFGLSSTSPAIDAAEPVSLLSISDDIFLNPRVNGGVADMGAIEY